MPSRNVMKALIRPTINEVESLSLQKGLAEFDVVRLPPTRLTANAESVFIKHNSPDGKVV
jgi:hypothetical protein